MLNNLYKLQAIIKARLTPVKFSDLNCKPKEVREKIEFLFAELESFIKGISIDTKEHKERFTRPPWNITEKEYDELIAQWDLHKEAHNGFDCYIAYEYIRLKHEKRRAIDHLEMMGIPKERARGKVDSGLMVLQQRLNKQDHAENFNNNRLKKLLVERSTCNPGCDGPPGCMCGGKLFREKHKDLFKD